MVRLKKFWPSKLLLQLIQFFYATILNLSNLNPEVYIGLKCTLTSIFSLSRFTLLAVLTCSQSWTIHKLHLWHYGWFTHKYLSRIRYVQMLQHVLMIKIFWPWVAICIHAASPVSSPCFLLVKIVTLIDWCLITHF